MSSSGRGGSGKLKDIINLKSSQDNGASGRKVALDDPSVDISALMKKALQAPKARSKRSPSSTDDAQKTKQEEQHNATTNIQSPTNAKDAIPEPSASVTPTNDAKSNKKQAEVPLAAKTLMKAHNRRKTVFQRPSRYGEWFDGDDEELERMVEEEELARGEEENNQQPSKPVDDVANKVHAIANSLCEKLDGLIEESPAVKQSQTDNKSLRDKLLESWEGRSYYDRLMQMAGINNEREDDIRQQLQKGLKRDTTTTTTDEDNNNKKNIFLSPPKKPRLRVDIDSLPPPDMAPKALSTTAVRKAISLALDKADQHGPATTTAAAAAALPVKGALKKSVPSTAATNNNNNININNNTTTSTNAVLIRSNSTNSTNMNTTTTTKPLLRVSSARGAKPMPAPWQNSNGNTPTGNQPLQKQKSVRIAEPEDAHTTIESLRAQIQSLSVAKVNADTEIGQLKIKLKLAQDKAAAEVEARKAAEKRIEMLEAELQSLRSSNGGDGLKSKARAGRRKS